MDGPSLNRTIDSKIRNGVKVGSEWDGEIGGG